MLRAVDSVQWAQTTWRIRGVKFNRAWILEGFACSTMSNKVKTAVFIGGFVTFTIAALFPVAVYPKLHPEVYRKFTLKFIFCRLSCSNRLSQLVYKSFEVKYKIIWNIYLGCFQQTGLINTSCPQVPAFYVDTVHSYVQYVFPLSEEIQKETRKGIKQEDIQPGSKFTKNSIYSTGTSPGWEFGLRSC